jgi:replicative DNA helicase
LSPPIENRAPPHDRHAEQAMLSAMLVDSGCIDDITAELTAEDLYFDAHQKLYRAVVELVNGGKPVDLVSVREELRRLGQLDDIGGDVFLVEVFDTVPTAANAVYHAGIVRGMAVRRRAIRYAHEILRDAAEGRQPANDLLASIESKAFELASGVRSDGTGHVRQDVMDEMNRLDSLGQNTDALPGISTGFADLDDMTGGWQEGLYMIGARPSVGKSAFMLSAALSAVIAGVPTLLFSLEMSRRQLVQRHLAMLSGTNLKRMRGNQRLTDREAECLIPAADSLMKAPLFVNDSAGMRVSQIFSTTRRMVRKEGVRLIFIDYAQLIEPDEGRSNAGRVEQLETISRRLKLLSRSIQIPVVALAQLNRVAAERSEEKPRLHDFKGSGSLEQDADDAYLLWRIECPDGVDVWTIGLDVAKQRKGPTGEIRLAYRRACTRFENHSAEVR